MQKKLVGGENQQHLAPLKSDPEIKTEPIHAADCEISFSKAVIFSFYPLLEAHITKW